MQNKKNCKPLIYNVMVRLMLVDMTDVLPPHTEALLSVSGQL